MFLLVACMFFSENYLLTAHVHRLTWPSWHLHTKIKGSWRSGAHFETKHLMFCCLWWLMHLYKLGLMSWRIFRSHLSSSPLSPVSSVSQTSVWKSGFDKEGPIQSPLPAEAGWSVATGSSCKGTRDNYPGSPDRGGEEGTMAMSTVSVCRKAMWHWSSEVVPGCKFFKLCTQGISLRNPTHIVFISILCFLWFLLLMCTITPRA